MNFKTIKISLFGLVAIGLTACASDDGTTAAVTSQTITTATSISGNGTLGGSGTIVTTNYNANVTISGCSSSAPVTLSGLVYIGDGATLTVNSGCTIKASSSVFSALVILQGGKIDAQGTSSSPIIWTSDKAAGSRTAQDWGGIVIQGKAPVNNTAGSTTATDTEIGTGPYGGTVTNDNSGTMKYNQVNFAGKEIATDQEFNGLFLAGVGSGTTMDYIQVANGSDDGVEIFGGNVNVNYLVLFNNQDDAFDLDEGWIGSATHLAIDIADKGDNCIEYDGLGADTDRPSNSVISNVTCVSDSDNTKKSILTIKKTGCVTLVNSLFEGFSSQYLAVEQSSVSKDNATLSSALTFDYGTCDVSANSVVFADITGKGGTTVSNGTTTTDFTCGNGNSIDDGSDCDASTSAHWVALSTLFPGGTTNAAVVSGVLTGANDATTRAEFVPSSNPGTAAGATVAHPASGSNVTIGNYNGAVDQANASAWLLDSWTDFAYN